MATWVVLPIVTPLAVMGVLCASCGGGTSLVGDGAEADAALGDEDQTADDAPVEGVEAADDSAEAAIDGAGRCGDGVRDAHEDCDDRPANNDERPNACRTTCVRAFCRDRVVDSGELSADGNPDPCDGCGGCALATARDRRPGEECDDCNSDNTDACIGGFIALARCGDGHVWRGHEECDDGNEVAGDGCESDCRWTCETAWDCNDSDECSGVETCGADHVCLPGVPLPDGSPCCPWGPEDCTDPWAEGWCVDGHCESYAMCGDGYVRAGYEECDLAPRSCETTCGSVGSEECAETCVWSGVCTPPAEACNGVDDDCDGAIDEDPCPEDCCTDRLDNDHDGFADCEDPDCVTDPWCTPCRDGPEICWDGCDNDGDCGTDERGDWECYYRYDPCFPMRCRPGPEICWDGCDNDRDFLVDCTDSDCVGLPECPPCIPAPEGDGDFDSCFNGVDDDCDGLTDICCDPDCHTWCDPYLPEDCTNGIDDNWNGRMDSGCRMRALLDRVRGEPGAGDCDKVDDDPTAARMRRSIALAPAPDLTEGRSSKRGAWCDRTRIAQPGGRYGPADAAGTG